MTQVVDPVRAADHARDLSWSLLMKGQTAVEYFGFDSLNQCLMFNWLIGKNWESLSIIE